MVEELGNETVRAKCVPTPKITSKFLRAPQESKLLYWKFTSLICFYNELTILFLNLKSVLGHFSETLNFEEKWNLKIFLSITF